MAGIPQRAPSVTVTSTTLLDGLREAEDGGCWEEFVARYRPLILGYCKRAGLTAEDAEDVAQGSLLCFSRDYRAGKYDRDRGRLRSWLFGIVQNVMRGQRRKADRERPVQGTRGDELFANLTSPQELEQLWEDEWRQAVLTQCLAEVRRELQPKTFEVFELYAIEGRSVEEVSARLGVSRNAVYCAKRRVLERVRELRPLLEESW